MLYQIICDALLVFGLGLGGWQIVARLRMPAPEILGPVVLIGALRVWHTIDLPSMPEFFFPAAQVILGIFIGSMLDRKAARELKSMALSALVIVVWTLSMIVIIGFFLERYSVMDFQTALLSASMGGLPEITVLAMASGASAAVIIVMQLIRMLGSIMLFPVLFQKLENKKIGNNKQSVMVSVLDTEDRPEKPALEQSNYKADHAHHQADNNPRQNTSFPDRIKLSFNRRAIRQQAQFFRESWKRVLLTLVVAAAGGLFFDSLGVPAGLMIGSTFFVATASLTGLPVSKISQSLLSILLVAVGINVAESITLDTILTMTQTEFVMPILIATTVMFASSLGVAWIIHRLTGWDLPTSLLAAAPGGFTVMTALAIKHDLDPVKVSMLHLCRLFAIKLFIPFVFMWLI